jgi:hypothetical protein
LVPEALVKNSVGNVPYPEAVMLVEETLVTDMVPSETCPTTDRYPDRLRLCCRRKCSQYNIEMARLRPYWFCRSDFEQQFTNGDFRNSYQYMRGHRTKRYLCRGGNL